MRSIGIRELRQHASRYLREVQRGESLQVTDRGRPIAMISPIESIDSRIERLRRAGRIRPAAHRLEDLGPPLDPIPGSAPLSAVLERMRADER